MAEPVRLEDLVDHQACQRLGAAGITAVGADGDHLVARAADPP